MILFLFSGLLLLIYISLLLYYRSGWKAIPDFKITSPVRPSVFISVIIPARNEVANLPILLAGLKAQLYPSANFEVIVVDDHSEDNTSGIVKDFSMDNLCLLQLQDFVTDPINSYKKKAIEVAISHSKGELIVTTDADCIVQPAWLQTIAAFYEERKPSFIVMPVAINKSENLLEIFQDLDFVTLQGITAASVQKKFHSMCNGANLAYTRSAFTTVGGFKGIDTIASGDDLLLMHKIYKNDPAKVAYLKSQEVVVRTAPMHSFSEFINQRVRWASKADKYADKRIFAVLLFVYLFNVLLLILPFIALINNEYEVCNFPVYITGLWIILLFFKTIFELLFIYPVAKFFNKGSLLYIFPLLQPFHIIYTVIAGWLGKFGSYKWKERKVK